MSKINFSKKELTKTLCNHNDQLKKNIELKKSYFYCFKCNNLILIDGNKTYCTYRFMPRFMDDEEEETEKYEEKIEFDPVLIVKGMIQRQDEHIKDVNDKLVRNFSNTFINDESNKENYNIEEKINESISTVSNKSEDDKKENLL